MLKKIILLFCLLSYYPYLYAQEDIQNINKKGEKLTFSINYGGISVGRNIMSLQNITTSDYKQAYALKIYTRSLPFFSLFFKVDDFIESIVNIDNFQPYIFKKNLREGNYKKDEIITFDYQESLAYTNQHPVKIPKNVYDSLSALYYLRTRELKIGNSIFLNVISGEKVYNLEVEVLRREELHTIFGKIKTIVIRPKMMFEGVFKHQDEILIWLTDDFFKIPVLLKSKIILGSIYATLIKKENF